MILDEPTVGFDPNVKREFWELIQDLKNYEKTVLISTHDMFEADELCDRVAIMDKGKIVAIDKPDVLKKTIGGQASIRIKTKDASTKKALSLLKKYNCTSINDEIQVFVKDPWKVIPEISNKLISHGVLTEKIEVVEPTLEDVFIKLTGRRLTEK